MIKEPLVSKIFSYSRLKDTHFHSIKGNPVWMMHNTAPSVPSALLKPCLNCILMLVFCHSDWFSTSLFSFSLFIDLFFLLFYQSFSFKSIVVLLSLLPLAIILLLNYLLMHLSPSISQTDRLVLKSGGVMRLPSGFHHLLLCFLSVTIYFTLPPRL